MSGYHEIERCRVGGDTHLVSVLNLGMQSLTGVFPRSADEPVGQGPLELVWAPQSGLLQLRHSFQPSEMYGENYGYRSGLNQSMVDHLTGKVRALERLVPLAAGDTVLDIGSNDATLLKAYRSWSRVRASESPAAYLRRMLTNTYLSHRRPTSRRLELLTGSPPEHGQPPPGGPEDRMLLWPHVTALPPRQRAVIVLRYYEDLSEREIAEALGCSTGNVKSTAHRALKALRERIGDAGGREC